LTESWHC